MMTFFETISNNTFMFYWYIFDVQLWPLVAVKWEQFNGSTLRACRWKRRGRDCSACVVFMRCLWRGDMRFENECIVTHSGWYLCTSCWKTGSQGSHTSLTRSFLSNTSSVIRHEIMTCKIICNALFHFLVKNTDFFLIRNSILKDMKS